MAEDQEVWLVPTTWEDEREHRRRLSDLANRLAAAHGLPTRYSRLSQPAGVMAITAPSGTQLVTRGGTNAWLRFDQTKTYGMSTSFTLPPDYEEGEPITPLLHWFKATSLTGSVMWWSTHQIFPVGVVATGFTASATGSGRQTAVAAITTQYEVVFPDIVSLTGLGAGTIVEIRFGRLHLSGGDDHSAEALLASFDLIYPTNARGHDEPFTKYIDTAS